MKIDKKFRLALVGTDTLRGKEMKNLLEKGKLPCECIDFFDPDVSGEYSKLTQFMGEPKVIHPLLEASFSGTDLVFLAADKKSNRKFGDLAGKENFQAIDLSETFNSDENVPLVVAGVNSQAIHKGKPAMISNPHPVTIILSHVFHMLSRAYGILKAIAFVLQPVSAFEESGIDELAGQSVALLNSTTLPKKVFKDQIAFNLLSHFEAVSENGFSSSERQISREIARVFQDRSFPLSVSIIQAPVFHTYSIMTYLELEKPADISGLEERFKESSYFKLPSPRKSYPVSSISVAGKEDIFIGQIKKEGSFLNSFWIWAVADNLTRGSALNALEIAKEIRVRSPE